jgi:hypothetical protein
MKYRVLSFFLFAAALVVFMGAPLDAQDKGAGKDTHVGKLVNVKGQDFTMEDKTGKKHNHTLAKDAKIFDPNGKECKLADLKSGQIIRVTTKAGDVVIATRVEALKKKTE